MSFLFFIIAFVVPANCLSLWYSDERLDGQVQQSKVNLGKPVQFHNANGAFAIKLPEMIWTYVYVKVWKENWSGQVKVVDQRGWNVIFYCRDYHPISTKIYSVSFRIRKHTETQESLFSVRYYIDKSPFSVEGPPPDNLILTETPFLSFTPTATRMSPAVICSIAISSFVIFSLVIALVITIQQRKRRRNKSVQESQ